MCSGLSEKLHIHCSCTKSREVRFTINHDMASSGDVENSSTVTGEPQHSYICFPCDTEGKKLKAVGYCVNCREYLCRRCFDVHLIPFVTRRHKLLDEQHMTEIESIDKSICSEHKDKHTEYHCPTHSFFGCHLCFYNHQKDCKDVKLLKEVSENITNSEEYKLFNEKLTNIVCKCTQLVTEIKCKTKTTAARNTEVVAAIREFKREVLDALDEREKELLAKADRVKKEETAQMTEVSEKCNAILMETQNIVSTMEVLQCKQQNCGLYMTFFQSKDKILSLETDLHTAGAKLNNNRFVFSANSDLLNVLKSPFGLGKLNQPDTITKAEHVQDVNIKAGDDKTTCRPLSSVLLQNNKLVIADGPNDKLKLLDTRQSKLTSELKLSGYPYGVCQITEENVAATLSNEKKVALVRINPNMGVDRTFSVNGVCRGIGYCDGRFVVSFDSPQKVELLDVQGTVLQKFETDENGKALFCNPFQLTVNPENKLIYVSNCSSDNVLCMKFDGTVVARYEDSEMRGPWQTVFSSSGTAFVCGLGSSNTHQITEDCKKVKVLLTNANGLSSPESISYSEREGKLYIGMQTNDTLKAFQVSYATL